MLISFVLLFLIYKLGVFSSLNSALKPSSASENQDITITTGESSASNGTTTGKRVMIYGEASDPYPPEQNFFELPPKRKGKCVAVVGLQGTGTAWLSLVAQELLTLRKQQRSGASANSTVVWGVNRGWFSRKGADYEATIKLLQNDDLVVVNLRYDDLILGQADVVLESYRDLRDYVAFQIPSKKSEQGAFESLSKGFFHIIEWYPHVHYRMRFEDAVLDKATQVRNIDKSIFSSEAVPVEPFSEQDVQGLIDRVDQKMLKTKEFLNVAIHSSVPNGVGAYQTRLSPETIQAIEQEYRPWLLKYGYL